MAPRGTSSPSCCSSAPTLEKPLPETTKPGPSHSRVLGRRNPPMLRMVMEALQARERRQGTSVVAIKVYILHKYPTVDATRFKHLLKQALDTGVRRGLLTRPANSKAKGATGSFKLVPKSKRKRKTAPLTAPRRAKGPKNPGEPERDAARMVKVEKTSVKPGGACRAPSGPRTALEKAPNSAGGVRDTEAKVGRARKAPSKPGKATPAPSSASSLSQKLKARGSVSQQGAAETHRKTKERSQSTASKVQNGVPSPSKRKMAARAPNGTAVQEIGTGTKSKASAPCQGGGPKAQPPHKARKSPNRSGLPIKAPSSTILSKKAEVES